VWRGSPACSSPTRWLLRDRQDPKGLRILEQNYEGTRSARVPAAPERRKGGAFQSLNPATGKKEIVNGRVVRSGYAPSSRAWRTRRRPHHRGRRRIQFSLPGEPLFTASGDAILEPTLLWRLWSDKAGGRDVEISYLTGARMAGDLQCRDPEKGAGSTGRLDHPENRAASPSRTRGSS